MSNTSSWAPRDYTTAVAQVAAALAIKAAVTNVLTARARMKANDYRTGRPGAKGWKSDENVPPVVASFLSTALLTGLPSLPVETLVGYATNISENEPLFFALALAYAAAGAPAPWAAGAVKLYGASRFAHAATFLFETRQPTRAVAWLAGVGATVALGVAALSLKA